MESRCLQAQKICEAFLYAYLGERDAEKAVSFFAPDIRGAGTGLFADAFDRDSLCASLRRRISRYPDSYRIDWAEVGALPVGDTDAYVFASFTMVNERTDTEPPADVRTVSVARREPDGACRLRGVYVAAPMDPEVGRCGFGERPEKQVCARFQEQSFELLNHSLNGGLLAAYHEPGYPLYFINTRMLAALGYADRQEFEARTGGLILNVIHPDDRERVIRTIEESLCISDDYELRYRMCRKDGGSYWTFNHGRRISALDGREALVSVCTNVDHLMRLQDQLEDAARQLSRRSRELEEITGNLPFGVVKTQLDDRCTLRYVSDTFCRMVGLSEEELLGEHGGGYLELVCGEDREAFLAELRSAREGAGRRRLEYRLKTAAGGLIWVQEDYQMLCDGGETCCYSIIADVTAVKTADEALRTLTASIPGGVCQVRMDDDFTLVYGSAGFYELYGYTPEEMRVMLGNRLLAVIHRDDIRRIARVTRAAFENGEPGFEFEKRIFRRDGRMVWLLTRGNFISGGGGEPVMNCVVIDITARKRMEQELQINEERFRLALEQTPNMVFDYDIAGHTIRCFRHAHERCRMEERYEQVPESLIEAGMVHPDNAGELRAMYRLIEGGAPNASCVARLRAGSRGRYSWMRVKLTVIFAENGKPQRAVGVLEDITSQKEAEIAFAREEQYRSAMLSGSVGYAEFDLTRDTVDKMTGVWGVRPPEAKRLGYSAGLERTAETVIYSEDRKRYIGEFSRDKLRQAYAAGVTSLECEHRRVDGGGRVSWMNMIMHLVRDPATGDLVALSFLQDIDRRKREELSLKYQSRRDSLTDLYNKGATENMIREYLSLEPDTEDAFLIVDVDNFKEVNDTRGHPFGDRVLTEMAQRIRASFRSGDVVGRIGGDEFVVFMKKVGTQEKAGEKAALICALFGGEHPGWPHPSCSVGVSFYPMHGRTFEELYRCADIALYDAKRGGRNQFRIYAPDILPPDSAARGGAAIDQPGEARGAPEPRRAEYACDAYGGADVLLDEMSDTVYVSDPVTYDLLYLNRSSYEAFGFAGDEYRGTKCYQTLQGRDAPCPFCTNSLLGFDEYYVWEFENERLGRRFILKDKLIDWNGRPARMEYAMDVTDRENVSSDLADKLERENALLGCVRAMVSARTPDEALRIVLGAAERFYDAGCSYLARFDLDRMTYSNIRTWIQGREAPNDGSWTDVPLYPESLWMEPLRTGGMAAREDLEQVRKRCPAEYEQLRRRGVRSVCAAPIRIPDSPPLYLGIGNPGMQHQDIAFLETLGYFLSNELSKRRMQEKFEFMSYHDALTGLPNRNSYTRYVEGAARLARAGVIVGDINGLKQLNERYGHRRGDQAVLDTAAVFRGFFDENLIFRLSGDEFVVLCPGLSEEAFGGRVRALQAAFEDADGNGVSLGYAWSDDEVNLPLLVSHADERMYLVKQRYYKSARRPSKHNRSAMMQTLLRQLREGRFQMYLQPKAELAGGGIVGAEALVRYCDAEHGVVAPGRFIPMLESERMIRFIDLFMFEQVCAALSDWRRQGRRLPVVSLNFSRLTLLEDELIASLRLILSRYGIPGGFLEIEITETVGEMERSTISGIGEALKQEGFQIALDDFGTKYTSISMFSIMRFDTVKLDRGLIQKLTENENARTVVRHVVAMCGELGLRTLAEGIETEEQEELLRGLGCGQGQGFLYGKAVPRAEFETRFLAQN